MTSFRECGVCGGSGRHSFERCFECKGLGMIEDEEPIDSDEWECGKCSEVWEGCVPDCINCNPPPERS